MCGIYSNPYNTLFYSVYMNEILKAVIKIKKIVQSMERTFDQTQFVSLRKFHKKMFSRHL